MSMWSPWRGCKKCSDGCKYCYIHKGDAKRGIDTAVITKNDDKFYAPIAKKKNGEYKIKSGSLVYVCFSSDFFVEEADGMREECWTMIKQRPDLTFLFLTKRILRFYDCVPKDWGDGYDNVIIGCTVCTSAEVDTKLAYFSRLPIKHKDVILQPLIEEVDIENYLSGVELVVVGGESDKNARPLDYDWVIKIREQCVRQKVNFEFRQCGTHFIKQGKSYTLQTRELFSQARKANIDIKF